MPVIITIIIDGTAHVTRKWPQAPAVGDTLLYDAVGSQRLRVVNRVWGPGNDGECRCDLICERISNGSR